MEQEKQFLREHSTITLGTDKSWEPYVIVREDGSIHGYDADMLRKINELTGANFTLVAGEWHEMLEKVKRKEISGLSTAGIHEERKSYLNFSDYYSSIHKFVLVPRGNRQNILTDADLAGKTIAVQRNNLSDKQLVQNFTDSHILTLDSAEEMIRSVGDGRADAILGSAATLYLADRMGLSYLDIAYQLDQSLSLVFCVRKDWPEAVSILNKGLALIPKQERIKLVDKWFSASNHPHLQASLGLSDEEQNYIAANPELNLICPAQWSPFVFWDEESYQGLLVDYFTLLGARIGLDFSCEFSDRSVSQVEIIARAKAQEPLSDSDFIPLFENPYVILAAKKIAYIDSINSLTNMKVVMVQGLGAGRLFETKKSDALLSFVPNHNTAVELVATGKADVAVCGIIAATQAISSAGGTNVHIVGELGVKQQIGIRVAPENQILLEILKKSYKSLHPIEVQKINNKWLFVPHEHGTDYNLLWKTGSLFLVILLLVLLWARKLTQLNTRLQSSLLLINQNLLIISLDQEDRITDASEAFCSWSELALEKLINVPLDHLFTESRAAILNDPKYAEGYIEMRYKSSNNKLRYIEISPLKDSSAKSEPNKFIVHDITQKIESLKLKHEQKNIGQKIAILGDMHDGLGGVVTVLSMAAENGLRKQTLNEKDEHLMQISSLAQEGATEMRLLMSALERQDFSWDNLVSDLRQIANTLLSGGAIKLEFARPKSLPKTHLSQETFFSLYRFFKEVVANVIKHSAANLLIVAIKHADNRFALYLEDNGHGFDPKLQADGHGLRSMRMRAVELNADLQVSSTDKTRVQLSLPLGDHRAERP